MANKELARLITSKARAAARRTARAKLAQQTQRSTALPHCAAHRRRIAQEAFRTRLLLPREWERDIDRQTDN